MPIAPGTMLRQRLSWARSHAAHEPHPEELVDGDERPPTGSVDALPAIDHLADDLVPERHGELQAATAVAQEAQVGPADAGGEDPQHHLARGGWRGRHIDHLGLPGVGQAVGTHGGGQSR